MPARMLRYHVDLHLAYSLPVISVVLYLFETSIPTSPYREESRDEELLTMHYRVIALWTLDAQEYVERGIIGMYTFLPGMKGAKAPLLIQAIREMKERYTQSQLTRHLARFRIILRRSGMLSEEDKQRVEGYMQVYDSLIDQDPYFQQKLQQKAEEVEIQTSQQMVLDAVEDRYLSLLGLAREKIVLIRRPDVLRLLVKQIYKAPDEKTARWLLETLSL